MNEAPFVPGQPIGMSAAYFTPAVQKQLIEHHFDKSVPGVYETLATEIMGGPVNPDPNMVTISKEEFDRLNAAKIDSQKVKESVDSFFAKSPQPQYEQNQGIVNDPIQVQQQAVPPTNEPTNDIMQRLFPDNPQNNPAQSPIEQQPNVQPNQNEMMIQKVKESLTTICSERNIDPSEFLPYVQSVTLEDLADLFLAIKRSNLNGQQQVNPGQQQQPVNPAQQQIPQTAPQSPINLSEVQPNPTRYTQPTTNNERVNRFWLG